MPCLSPLGPREVIYRPAGLAYWTLNITHSGAGYFPQIDHLVLPGDCVLIHPIIITSMAPTAKRHLTGITIGQHFPALIGERFFALATASSSAWFAEIASRAYPQALYGGFASLVERADEAWPMRDELCLSQLRVVLSWINPHAQKPPESGPIQRAMDEIHAAPEYDWSVDELAALVGWSNSRLSHVFTGGGYSSPALSRAMPNEFDQGLLRGSESSIAAIAGRVGYTDPNYFVADFASIPDLAQVPIVASSARG